MKRLFPFPLFFALGTLQLLSAQNLHQYKSPKYDPLSTLPPSGKDLLRDQAVHIFSALKKPVSEASKSTVTIGHPSNRVAFGTVIKSPLYDHAMILTKWSEIANNHNRIFITTPNGEKFVARVAGVYPEHDLALLSTNEDTKLPALSLKGENAINLGDFVAVARHDGRAEGFGVISVKNRNIKDANKGFLGVQMTFQRQSGKGVILESVIPNSAAERAGLLPGDELIAIDKDTISGANQMRSALQKLTPGSQVIITYKRQGETKKTTAILGSRADDERLKPISTQRMKLMERMGTEPSRIRTNFPSVIQTDIAIEAEDVGSPVVNLDGQLIGITIARASRIKTYIIPKETIRKVLTTSPLSIEQALYGNR